MVRFVISPFSLLGTASATIEDKIRPKRLMNQTSLLDCQKQSKVIRLMVGCLVIGSVNKYVLHVLGNNTMTLKDKHYPLTVQ